MDIYQLQKQIQDLRQEVNTINQVASQLLRSEANNAAQLQQLHQHEVNASQQLHTIQQLCNRLNQDVNVIGNVAQQVTSQMFTKPMTSGQFGAYSQPTTGQFGAFSPSITTGLYNPSQQGMMGIPSNIASTYTTNLGTGFSPFASNIRLDTPQQQIQTGQYGTSGFTSSPFASNIRLDTPQQQMQTSQYGTSSYASNQFAPYSAGQLSASALPTTGLLSQPLSSTQNMGMYSSY